MCTYNLISAREGRIKASQRWTLP